MNLFTRKIFLLPIIVSALVTAVTSANAAKLYKWVDSNGNISYQDQPPPKNAKILNAETIKPSVSNDKNKSIDLPKILIYTVNDCNACEQMISMLNQSKIPHIRLPLRDDRKAQELILAQFSSIVVPTIFIDDKIIQSRSPDQVREMLKSAGFDVAQEGS